MFPISNSRRLFVRTDDKYSRAANVDETYSPVVANNKCQYGLQRVRTATSCFTYMNVFRKSTDTEIIPSPLPARPPTRHGLRNGVACV